MIYSQAIAASVDSVPQPASSTSRAKTARTRIMLRRSRRVREALRELGRWPFLGSCPGGEQGQPTDSDCGLDQPHSAPQRALYGPLRAQHDPAGVALARPFRRNPGADRRKNDVILSRLCNGRGCGAEHHRGVGAAPLPVPAPKAPAPWAR